MIYGLSYLFKLASRRVCLLELSHYLFKAVVQINGWFHVTLIRHSEMLISCEQSLSINGSQMKCRRMMKWKQLSSWTPATRFPSYVTMCHVTLLNLSSVRPPSHHRLQTRSALCMEPSGLSCDAVIGRNRSLWLKDELSRTWWIKVKHQGCCDLFLAIT